MATAKPTRKRPAKPKVGRRPSEDPKIRVMFYIETSVVNDVGGMEEAKARCIDFLRKIPAAQTLNDFLKPKPKQNAAKSSARKVPGHRRANGKQRQRRA